MRILHTSDWHIGKRLGSYSRLEEQERVFQEIQEISLSQSVDLILVAGDLFDTFHPSIEAERLYYRTLKMLSQDGKVPVIVIAGNHDSPDKIESSRVLAEEFGIQLLGYPNTSPSAVRLKTGLSVEEREPGVLFLTLPSGEQANILYTPYANESRLRQALFTDFHREDTAAAASSEQREDLAEASGEKSLASKVAESTKKRGDIPGGATKGTTKETALIELLAQRWQEQADRWCSNKQVNLLVTHLFLAGSDKESEEQEGEKSIDHPGGVSRIPISAVPEKIQYTALGHIHRGYPVRKDPPVVYSGSPLAYSVREDKNKNSLIIVDVKPGEPATYTRVPLTQGYPIMVQTFCSVAEAVGWLESHKGCYADITLQLEDYLSPQDTKALYQAHPRILDVRLAFEVEGTQESVGWQESRKDQNIYELFSDYFKQSKGIEPPQGVMDLFKEIVGEKL